MNGRVWGHRGCRGAGKPPENSIGAFHAAIEAGAGGIELDVLLSKDAVPVVLHDQTLRRMTGTDGEVSFFLLSQLQSLPLLTIEGRPSREKIPTLEEVLAAVETRRRATPFVVNIELKDPQSTSAVAEILTQRLAMGWTPENFLVSSFHIDCLREMRVLLPSLPLGALFEAAGDELAQNIREVADLKPSTINIPLGSLTDATLNQILSAEAKPVVWIPGETNPYDLPAGVREELLKTVHEKGVTVITDFPKELLHLLRPNKARATVKGVLAACLSYGQQNMLFRPSESGLEILKSPSEYPELQRFGFTQISLTAEDGVPFLAWERKGSSDRPHFLLFHGNRAHWGDTGGNREQQRDRRARLKFIAELASSGAGVTAVTLRGFGGSSAIPSELGFLRDLSAVSDHLATQRFDPRKLVVAGESLGTWAATQTAVYLTRRQTPPALLSLQNPFTSMAEVGEQVVSQFPLLRSFHVDLSASSLDRHVLKSHFYTASLFRELTVATSIHIATSGKDDLVHPSHSDKLADIAKARGLRVMRDQFPEALHHTIPPIDFARRLVCLGVESCLPTSDWCELWDDSLPHVSVLDQIPCL